MQLQMVMFFVLSKKKRKMHPLIEENKKLQWNKTTKIQRRVLRITWESIHLVYTHKEIKQHIFEYYMDYM